MMTGLFIALASFLTMVACLTALAGKPSWWILSMATVAALIAIAAREGKS